MTDAIELERSTRSVLDGYRRFETLEDTAEEYAHYASVMGQRLSGRADLHSALTEVRRSSRFAHSLAASFDYGRIVDEWVPPFDELNRRAAAFDDIDVGDALISVHEFSRCIALSRITMHSLLTSFSRAIEGLGACGVADATDLAAELSEREKAFLSYSDGLDKLAALLDDVTDSLR